MLLNHLLAHPWARFTMLEMPEIPSHCSLASVLHRLCLRALRVKLNRLTHRLYRSLVLAVLYA